MSNPAQRLHTILTQSKRQELARNTMLVGWRNVLSLPENIDDLILMSKIGKVFTLPSIIAKYIERFPDLDADLYLGWRNDLSAAFRAIQFTATFGQFSNRLSDSMLINIRFCANELDKLMPEKDVSRQELDAIRQSAWSLYEEILKSDFPPNVSRYLLDHLYLMIQAIDDYEITGTAGIEQSFDAVIGAAITNASTAKQAYESSVGKRFWSLMAKVGVLLKVGKTALELEEGVRKLLQ
jgi:hypothetical protein